ncbi:MAG: DinB family protein [Bacteroidota bacterium]
MPNPFETLFAEAFDTFKVFENLTLNEIDHPPAHSPKTIWQIINHLVAWQGHQLNQLRSMGHDLQIDEDATWVNIANAETQAELENMTIFFTQQLAGLKAEIQNLDMADADIMQKLRLVQDLSVHLSFHVGEVILMRRMTGNYPLPHQMKDFLG